MAAGKLVYLFLQRHPADEIGNAILNREFRVAIVRDSLLGGGREKARNQHDNGERFHLIFLRFRDCGVTAYYDMKIAGERLAHSISSGGNLQPRASTMSSDEALGVDGLFDLRA